MNAWGKTTDLIRLCRPHYTLPLAGAMLLAIYYARDGIAPEQWGAAIIATVSLAAVLAGAYVLYDVQDRQGDGRNVPARPSTAQEISPQAAMVLATLLFLLGLALAICCRRQFLLTLGAVAAGLVFYGVFSRQLGLLKPILAAGLMTCIYPLALAQAGLLAGPRAESLLVFPAWLFVTRLGYEFLKDVRDRADDPLLTVPSFFGPARLTYVQRRPLFWRRLAGVLIAAGSALLILPYFLGCGTVYLAGACFAMCLAVAAGAVALIAPAASPRWAIRLTYLECFVVGLAATADVFSAT